MTDDIKMTDETICECWKCGKGMTCDDVDAIPPEDFHEDFPECEECRAMEEDVPTFPKGANVPDVPEDGRVEKDEDGVAWEYHGDEDKWTRIPAIGECGRCGGDNGKGGTELWCDLCEVCDRHEWGVDNETCECGAEKGKGECRACEEDRDFENLPIEEYHAKWRRA